MKKFDFKQIGYWTSVIVIGIFVGVSLQFVKAWTEPGTTPPGGNLGAPINTGAATQNKAGSFGTSGSFVAAGAIKGKSITGATVTGTKVSGTTVCIGSSCRTTWPASVSVSCTNPTGLEGQYTAMTRKVCGPNYFGTICQGDVHYVVDIFKCQNKKWVLKDLGTY